jgi:aminoglycoside 2''-phosphotransferase
MGVDELLAYIRTDFPDLPIGSVRVVAHGWDHDVLDIDDTYIFRFPKDDDSRLPTEIRIVERLQGRTSLPIPHFEFVGRSATYVGYRKIQGGPLTPERCAQLSEADRDAVALQLATFLVEVHDAVPYMLAKDLGVVADSLHAYLREANAIRQRFSDPVIRDFINVTLDDFASMIVEPGPQTFLYNDLHGDNMAFDEHANRVVGVFDFGDAAIGDLHREFAPLYRMDRALLEHTVSHYQHMTGARLSLRRIIMIERVNRLSDLAETIDQPGNPEPGKVFAEIVEWNRELDLYR